MMRYSMCYDSLFLCLLSLIMICNGEDQDPKDNFMVTLKINHIFLLPPENHNVGANCKDWNSTHYCALRWTICIIAVSKKWQDSDLLDRCTDIDGLPKDNSKQTNGLYRMDSFTTLGKEYSNPLYKIENKDLNPPWNTKLQFILPPMNPKTEQYKAVGQLTMIKVLGKETKTIINQTDLIGYQKKQTYFGKSVRFMLVNSGKQPWLSVIELLGKFGCSPDYYGSFCDNKCLINDTYTHKQNMMCSKLGCPMCKNGFAPSPENVRGCANNKEACASHCHTLKRQDAIFKCSADGCGTIECKEKGMELVNNITCNKIGCDTIEKYYENKSPCLNGGKCVSDGNLTNTFDIEAYAKCDCSNTQFEGRRCDEPKEIVVATSSTTSTTTTTTTTATKSTKPIPTTDTVPEDYNELYDETTTESRAINAPQVQKEERSGSGSVALKTGLCVSVVIVVLILVILIGWSTLKKNSANYVENTLEYCASVSVDSNTAEHDIENGERSKSETHPDGDEIKLVNQNFE